MSRGLYDPDTGELLATINLEFEIGVLNDLIDSSISPQFSAIYSVYDTETQELVAGKGPELSQEQKDSFNLFSSRKEVTVGDLQYYCKMIYLDPGAIGNMPNVHFQPSSLEEALDYITHPNKPEYAKTYDFQVFLCHDFAPVTLQIGVLLDGIGIDNGLSILYVYLVTFVSFFLIGYMIYKFSIYVTKPITHLTVYTKRYKKAKGMDEKDRIIKDIEEDDLFEVTKLQLEKEQLDRGEHTVKVLRRQTINKSTKISQLERKHTKRSEKEKEVQQKTKNMDLRCQDEIDELKKIFFQFFVQPADVTQTESTLGKASDKKADDYGTDGRLQKQYQKDLDGIKEQLKELYDEKDLRQKKALEREKRKNREYGHEGSYLSCSSQPQEQDDDDKDALTSEAQRFHRYQQNLNVQFQGDFEFTTLLAKDGNTPKQMAQIQR